MDVYAIAAELIGSAELTPEQRARLRALNTSYLTGLQKLRRTSGNVAESAPSPWDAAPRPAEEERLELEARVMREIRELLADVQREKGDAPPTGQRSRA